MAKVKSFTIVVNSSQVNKLEKQFERIDTTIDDISKKTTTMWSTPSMSSFNKELRVANVELTKGGKSLGKYKKAVSDVDKAQKKANKSIKAGAAGMVNLVKGLAGVAGVVTIIKKAARVFKEMTKEAAVFNRTIGIASIVSGATTEEANKLRQTALDLGGQTEYTAKQIAELEVAYGKLGFKAGETLNLISDTANAATVSQEDLGKTAKIVGETIHAFGLESSDASRVADVLAKSFTSSALNLEKFGNIIGITGAAARASNVSLEEMTATMGTLANSGLKASVAATSFRNILLISQTEGKDYKDVLNDISKSTTKLADANEAFGRRAAVTATILSLQQKETEKLTKELQNSEGFSKRTAEAIRNDLAGSLDKMNSSIANLRIDYISQYGDAIKRSVDFTTDIISGLDRWITGTQQLSKVGVNTGRVLDILKSTVDVYIKIFKYIPGIQSLIDSFNSFSSFTARVGAWQAGISSFLSGGSYSEGFTERMNKYKKEDEALSKIQQTEKAIAVYRKLLEKGGNKDFYKKAIFDLENALRVLKGQDKLPDTQNVANEEFAKISAEFSSIGKDVNKALRLRDKVLNTLESNAENAGHSLTKNLKEKYLNLFVNLDNFILSASTKSLKTLKQSLKIVNDKLENLNINNVKESGRLVATRNRIQAQIQAINSSRTIGLINKQRALVSRLGKQISAATNESDIFTKTQELTAAKEELKRLESLGDTISLVGQLKKNIKELSDEIAKSNSIEDIFGKQKDLAKAQQELTDFNNRLKRNLAQSDPKRTGLLKSDISNLNSFADKKYLEAKKAIIDSSSNLAEREFAIAQLDLRHKITTLENKRKYYKEDTAEYKKYSDQIFSIQEKIKENSSKQLLSSQILDIQQKYLKANQELGLDPNSSALSAIKLNQDLEINAKQLAAAKEKGDLKEIISLETQRLDLLRKQNEVESNKHILSQNQAETLNFSLDKVRSIVEINNNLREADYNRDKQRIIDKYAEEEKLAANNTAKLKDIKDKKDKELDALDKKRFERQKKQQIALAVISGSQAIVSTLAAVPGFLDSASLGIWRAIQIAFTVATTAAQIAKIKSTKYALGGYTGNGGRAPRDDTGHRPAGVVHENEYVIGVRDMGTPFGQAMASTAETYRNTGQIDLWALRPYINRNTLSQTDIESLAHIIINNTSEAVRSAMIEMVREQEFLNGANY